MRLTDLFNSLFSSDNYYASGVCLYDIGTDNPGLASTGQAAAALMKQDHQQDRRAGDEIQYPDVN